jgi:hypothetical protein
VVDARADERSTLDLLECPGGRLGDINVAKHVCPVCEDVYAVHALVEVRSGAEATTTESWGCPSCGYVFVDTTDLGAIIAEHTGAPSTVSVRLASSQVSRRR